MEHQQEWVCPKCGTNDQLVAAFHEHVEYAIGKIGTEEGEPVILELGDPEILGEVYSERESYYCDTCESMLELHDLMPKSVWDNPAWRAAALGESS